MTLESVLVVSAVIFSIGLFGSLARRNVIVVLMSIELMFNAVNIAAIAFSRFTVPASLADGPVALTADAMRQVLTGQVFAVFVIAVAAAEVTLGLALAVAIYRRRESSEVTDLTSARG
ncbi:MAG: NADH-quinone oxidoreductase subunit NuoK [Chloroflexi bacterium]|nr:NADH-quinone oxidoreductase subunit NuoK [Chloroflexota bacterium]